MEATIRSVWNWAAIQFNNAVGGIRSLWYKLLDILSFLKDSIGSLISSLKARFCYSSETASITQSMSVPSNSRPVGELTERVEVHRRKTEFEFEVGNPPAKRRRGKSKEKEKEIELLEGTRDFLDNIVVVMKEDLRASSTAEAEKTTARIQNLLESRETENLIAGLRTANLSLV
ncbi:uncharacterized protein LOC116296129 [Actinia tenebrosa]|uniref:Uncharacterized protein LOC116296129 n=1 Tax=Actinia tenebrosa TaxID=6105 RepID=A0A6P8HX87_ACTTE|nr:uncharacterized protein LOC116296129 [Actinia tenebrosa]